MGSLRKLYSIVRHTATSLLTAIAELDIVALSERLGIGLWIWYNIRRNGCCPIL